MKAITRNQFFGFTNGYLFSRPFVVSNLVS